MIEIIQEFGITSGYKINQRKSEMIGINIIKFKRQIIQNQYLDKWKNRGLKYLGIKFAEDLQLMVQDNIGAMIEKIDKQLKQWIKLPLTWLGRISVIKMNVLPQLLFLFISLNMAIPKKMILDLQKMINKFIW